MLVENTHYFPKGSLNPEYVTNSSTQSVCGWKGTASYYHLAVDGKTNPDAVWFYPEPQDAAKEIQGHVAFWKGVEISE